MTRTTGILDRGAATQPPLATIAAPYDPEAIPLPYRPDGLDRPEESWFLLNDQQTARNIAVPTLTPFLPAPGKATGAAMIVAPGGGFVIASMENEGWPVARWLAAWGITAFVLKYRLEPTPAAPDEFRAAMVQRFMAAASPDGRRSLATPASAVADGAAAIRLVRDRADDWHIDRDRVGFLGFSAGAMIGLNIVAQRGDTRPDCLATIYPSMETQPVAADAPPLFAAIAADDPLFGRQPYDLPAAWRAADRPVEFHLYRDGGHGFGMGKPGTTSMGWRDDFERWLGASGWLTATR